MSRIILISICLLLSISSLAQNNKLSSDAQGKSMPQQRQNVEHDRRESVAGKNWNPQYLRCDRHHHHMVRRNFMVDSFISSSWNKGLMFQTDLETRMTILSSNGFVGIGIADPLEILHLNRSIRGTVLQEPLE